MEHLMPAAPGAVAPLRRLMRIAHRAAIFPLEFLAGKTKSRGIAGSPWGPAAGTNHVAQRRMWS
jgi:hypothetical protein